MPSVSQAGQQAELQGKRDNLAATDPSPVSIAAMLGQAGFTVLAGALRRERRGDRMLVLADGDWLVWFPLGPQAAAEIRVENRLLALLAGRCSIQTPRPLFTSPEGWTVRAMDVARHPPQRVIVLTDPLDRVVSAACQQAYVDALRAAGVIVDHRLLPATGPTRHVLRDAALLAATAARPG